MTKLHSEAPLTWILPAIAALLLAGLLWFTARRDGTNALPSSATGPEAPSEAAAAETVITTGLDDDPALEAVQTGRQGSRVQLASEHAAAATPPGVLAVSGRVVVVGGKPMDPRDLQGSLRVTIQRGRSGSGILMLVKDGQFRLTFQPSAKDRLATVEPDHPSQSQSHRTPTPVPGELLRTFPAKGLLEPERVPRWRFIPAATDKFGLRFSAPYFSTLGAASMARSDGTGLGKQAPLIPFGSKDVVVYVRRAPLTTLNVLDKQSGAHLSGVRVLGPRMWAPGPGMRALRDARHPLGIDTTPLVESANSPVALDLPMEYTAQAIAHVLVGADGYAWAPTALDLRVKEHKTIELERGGGLHVSIDGQVPPAAQFRLYRGAPISSPALRGPGTLDYGDLTPGPYSARIELGEWHENPRVLASQDVVVVAGGNAVARLSVEPLGTAVKARASGVLVIPAAWEFERFTAHFERVDVASDGSRQKVSRPKGLLKELPSQPGTYAFQLPPMEVGQIRVLLEPSGWTSRYDLPPGGRSDLCLELPGPVDLTVHIVDEDTGLPVEVKNVSWRPGRPGEVARSPNNRATKEAPGQYRLRVTEGPVTVSCSDHDYNHARVTVDTRTSREVTLKTTKSACATIVFRNGTKTVGSPPLRVFSARALDGNGGRLSTLSRRAGKPWFKVTKPGRYRLSFPNIDGFEPIDALDVEMVKGKEIEITVDLVPR